MKRQKLDRIQRLFLNGREIDRALERASDETLLRHKQLGHPIVIWRDGKIVHVPPEEIEVRQPKKARKVKRK